MVDRSSGRGLRRVERVAVKAFEWQSLDRGQENGEDKLSLLMGRGARLGCSGFASGE